MTLRFGSPSSAEPEPGRAAVSLAGLLTYVFFLGSILIWGAFVWAVIPLQEILYGYLALFALIGFLRIFLTRANAVK